MTTMMHVPDVRQITALQAQLGVLEQMLRPVLGGQPAAAPNNVVPMPARPTTAPQQTAMQQQMMDNMLAAVDPQRAGQIRALMTVANKPNVSSQEMDAAVAPLIGQLAPQDQSTVRMMLSMMQQQQPVQQPTQVATSAPALPAPVVPAYTLPPDVQQTLDQVTARAATALEEARRVAAELVALKDTQSQTAAAMYQQTQVMRDMLQMLKTPAPESPADDAEEHQPQDAAS